MPIIKLSANERRRISVFFTCLVLSGIAWVFTMLSNEYDFKVKEAVRFKNPPQKRAFHSLQTDTIVTTIKGTGWEMLFSRINFNSTPIVADLHTLDNRNYIVLSSQLNEINSKRDANKQILAFDPDTLYFDFANRAVKKVPVELISRINYQHQFTQADNIVIKPAYVTVTGPANVLDKISIWKTDTLKADSVDESITQQLRLKPPPDGGINVYPRMVNVTVPVDEFTEKTIEIPVKVINKGDYNVKIFPQKIKVTFTTSLNRFEEIDQDMFEADADLDDWSKNGYSTLPVKLVRIPDYSKIVKIEPQNIDFIVKK